MTYSALAAWLEDDSQPVIDSLGHPVTDSLGNPVVNFLHVKGDVAWEPNGPYKVSGILAIHQKIEQRFKMFLGEWYLNLAEGVPYYRDVFKKNPTLSVIESVFRKVLLSTPGVKEVRSFKMAFNSKTRKLSASYEVGTDEGATLTRTAFEIG